MQDHAMLRRSLDILDAMADRLESGQRIEISDAITILKIFRALGDEYSEEQALVAQIEKALQVRKGGDFVRNSRRLSLVLRNRSSNEKATLESFSDLSRLESKYSQKRTRAAASSG
jgi:hypothetical protein